MICLQILSKTDCNRNAVIINVSPMEYGHVLLVPHIDACLTQVSDTHIDMLKVEYPIAKCP